MDIQKSLISLFIASLILVGSVLNLRASEDLLEEGIAHYKSENYEEALESLTKAREQQPTSALASYFLGLTYKQLGQYRESIKPLIESLDLRPPVKEAYTEIIDTLYILNELKEAKVWIGRAEKEGIRPAQIAFLKGLVLLKEGMTKEAIQSFEKAKQADSSLTQTADLQITLAYAKERRFDKARDNLKTVISMDPTTEVASFAREYENAIARSLEGHKKWQGTGGAAYQYDTNVVLKPTADIPGLRITGERDSSVITTARLNYNTPLGGAWFFNGQYSFYANTYADVHTHNLIDSTLFLSPGYNFSNGALTFPASFSYIWVQGDEYLWLLSVRPAFNFMFFPNHIGQISAGYARREMLQSPLIEEEDRTGNIYYLLAGYSRPFSEGKGVFNLRYELSRDVTHGKNWDNTGHRFNGALLIPVVDKVKLNFSGEAFLQDYNYANTAFGVKRKDRTYFGSGGLTWEMLRGLSLNLQYSYTKVNSNIDVYAYDRNIFTIGLEYTF